MPFIWLAKFATEPATSQLVNSSPPRTTPDSTVSPSAETAA